MWEVIYKALLISIYKQINYYSIASEYYTGFKAELGCHYNRWNLKILGVFSVLSFVLSGIPLHSLFPDFHRVFCFWGCSTIFLFNPTSPALIPRWTWGRAQQIPGPWAIYSYLSPFHWEHAPKSFLQVRFLTQHIHIYLVVYNMKLHYLGSETVKIPLPNKTRI